MSTVFDLIGKEGQILTEEPTVEPFEKPFEKKDEKTVFDIYSEAELSQPSIPWWKSVSADVLKGALEGLQRFGRMLGPLVDVPPQQAQEEFTERLEELIPSDKTITGAAARRGLGMGMPMLGFPGGGTLGTILRSGAAGVAGQAVEEMGGPRWLQTAAEIAPFLAPGLGKQIQPTERQRDIVEFLRKKGATEEEIAPLLPGQLKKRMLSLVAQKGTGAEGRLQATKDMLGRIYENLKVRPEAETVLSEGAATRLINNLQDKLQDMPARVRNIISEDFQQLVNSPKDGKSIMKFYQDVNAEFGPRTKQLGNLKEPLKEAVTTINPELGKDFDLTNQLYHKFAETYKRLTPKNANLLNQLIDVSEWGRVAAGIWFGQYPMLTEAIGEKTGRLLAREMLINPRFQNLGKQVAQALNTGKYAIANRLRDQTIRMIKDKHPEAAAELQKVDFTDLEEIKNR